MARLILDPRGLQSFTDAWKQIGNRAIGAWLLVIVTSAEAQPPIAIPEGQGRPAPTLAPTTLSPTDRDEPNALIVPKTSDPTSGSPSAPLTPPTLTPPTAIGVPPAIDAIQGTSRDFADETILTNVYQADDLVDAMARQYEVDPKDAQQLLAYEMRRTLKGSTGQFRWNGKNLVVRAPASLHKVYSERLGALRSTMFEELEVSVCLAKADSETVKGLSLEWNVDPTPPLGGPEGPAPLNTAVASTARRQALKWAIVPARDSGAIEEQLQQSDGFQIIGRPQVRLFNGRRATAESAVERRFVVGLKDQIPQVQVIPHGWLLDILPETRGQRAIIRGHCTFSEVLGFETVETPRQRLQIPEVQQRRLSWTTDLPLGDTLVIAGQRTPYQGKEGQASKGSDGGDTSGWNEMVVLMRITRVYSATSPDELSMTRPASESTLAAPLETRRYAVSHLLPKNAISAQRRLREVAQLLSASLQQKTGIAGDVAADAENRVLRIRQTAQGHHAASQLLSELGRMTFFPHLEASVISVSEDTCKAIGLTTTSCTVLPEAELNKLLADNDDPTAAGTSNLKTLRSSADGHWQLPDGSRVMASAESMFAGRMTRVELKHQRGEVVSAECRRELTAHTCLLLDITEAPPALDTLPSIGATIRRTLSLGPALERKYLVLRVNSTAATDRDKLGNAAAEVDAPRQEKHENGSGHDHHTHSHIGVPAASAEGETGATDRRIFKRVNRSR